LGRAYQLDGLSEPLCRSLPGRYTPFPGHRRLSIFDAALLPASILLLLRHSRFLAGGRCIVGDEGSGGQEAAMSEGGRSIEMRGTILSDEVVPPCRPWGRIVRQGEVLRLTDLEGQQAVDFLCYDAADPRDRYSSMNTIKVQGSIFVQKGTVMYSDMGNALLTVIEDTCGRHDTIMGCCSQANNFLRYGVHDTPSCYANFLEILGRFGLGRSEIVGNVNFFMNVPVERDGRTAIADGVSRPGSLVDLRAERDVLAVLSNCPQMHNPCNGYNPTPVRCTIWRPDA
jgi:urea carboxylase-associated protein 1